MKEGVVVSCMGKWEKGVATREQLRKGLKEKGVANDKTYDEQVERDWRGGYKKEKRSSGMRKGIQTML